MSRFCFDQPAFSALILFSLFIADIFTVDRIIIFDISSKCHEIPHVLLLLQQDAVEDGWTTARLNTLIVVVYMLYICLLCPRPKEAAFKYVSKAVNTD